MVNYLDTILTRLRLCHLELVAVTPTTFSLKTAYKLIPLGQVAWDNWPFAFVTPGDATYTYPAPDTVEIRQSLLVTIIVSPRNADTIDSAGNSEALLAAVTLQNSFIDYYLTHPDLHTASLGALGYLVNCLPASSRPVVLEAEPQKPGGPKNEYAGVQITLRTLIKHTISNSLISYGGL